MLQCATCHSNIGTVHYTDEAYKLRKSQLALSPDADSAYVSFESAKWLACHLLSSMETQGVRKFRIQCGQHMAGLKVWIFTPDITISSSAADVSDPIRAVKILWTDSQETMKESGALTRQALSEGEMELASDEFEDLRQALVKSAYILPENARKFQAWHVAMLPRFTASDVGCTAATGRAIDLASAPVTLPEIPDVLNKEILSPLTS